VALVAAPEVRAETDDGRVMEPAGIYAVPLPFADDVRTNVPLGPQPVEAGGAAPPPPPPPALVDAAAMVIASVALDTELEFRSETIPNPALAKWHAVSAAMALGGRDAPLWDEARDDATRPDPARFAAPAAALALDQFAIALAEAVVDLPPAAGAKRPRGGGADGDAKRARAEPGDPLPEVDLGHCVLPELRDYLRARGLPTTGRKDELIERVRTHRASLAGR
jgi:hypothetical protein